MIPKPGQTIVALRKRLYLARFAEIKPIIPGSWECIGFLSFLLQPCLTQRGRHEKINPYANCLHIWCANNPYLGRTTMMPNFSKRGLLWVKKNVLEPFAAWQKAAACK
jgi:hypothetical protein